jgi:hypothetical protein
MPEQTVTTTVVETDAERAAAAAAEAETRAAQLTADANRNAADRIASFEGRLDQWQTDLTTLSETTATAVSNVRTELLAQSEQTAAELRSSLASILQKLEPPPEPPPPNLTPPPGAGAGTAPAPPAEPSPPPAAKRAHRWI